MGQTLHGSARTTAAVRRAIQDSKESLVNLAESACKNHQLCRISLQEESS